METAKQHLLSTNSANAGGHGHSHSHSSSCGHSHSSMAFFQSPEPLPPVPEVSKMTVVQAVQYNELGRVKELIESGQHDVNTPDEESCYLMHWAAINNCVDIMRYFIAKGANVDIKGGDLKSTPLHWACRQGCTEAFLLLVDNGAAIDSTDANGLQCIHLAAQYGQLKILAYLLGSGIDIDCHDGRGFTPLIYSCLGPPQTYEPLQHASHVSCTQFLISYGASINYQEPTRRFTALHFSILSGNVVSLSVLLNNPQTNINLTTIDNCDAITFAHMRQNAYAVEALENYNSFSKKNIKPSFLQRYFTNDIIRKWTARTFMFFFIMIVGLSANSYEHPIWLRILVPIGVIFILIHILNYYACDKHTLENLAFGYVFSITVLMYVTYNMYLQESNWTWANYLYHLVTFYGFYSFYWVKHMNPGKITQQFMILDGHPLTKEKICIAFARDPQWTLDQFCVTCLIRRPLRSKHCPADGVCVARFDHHCTWLDACIGGNNYYFFIRILISSTLGATLWMYDAIHLLSFDLEQFSLKYILTDVYDPWYIYIFILTTFNTIWVPCMTSFHLYNSIYLGVTLNERLTRFRYNYFRDEKTGKFLNPFEKQLLKNFLETLGFHRLMKYFGYTRIDWTQIYHIDQINGTKLV